MGTVVSCLEIRGRADWGGLWWPGLPGSPRRVG